MVTIDREDVLRHVLNDLTLARHDAEFVHLDAAGTVVKVFGLDLVRRLVFARGLDVFPQPEDDE